MGIYHSHRKIAFRRRFHIGNYEYGFKDHQFSFDELHNEGVNSVCNYNQSYNLDDKQPTIITIHSTPVGTLILNNQPALLCETFIYDRLDSAYAFWTIMTTNKTCVFTRYHWI